MKIKLPDSISSKQDLSSLVLELHDYERWFMHEAIKKNIDTTNVSTAPVLSLAATELLRNIEAKQAINQENLDELIEKIRDYSRAASQITITLAAPVTASLKTSLVKWCRENISSNILVNFQFNSTLLGGMVVRYGSRIFDWSFRHQLIDARNNFPEALRNV